MASLAATTEPAERALPSVMWRDDAVALSRALFTARRALHRGTEPATIIEKHLPANVASALTMMSDDRLPEHLTQLSDRLLARPTISFTLAAEPSTSQKDWLVGWVGRVIHHPCLVTYTVDPSLVAGVVIEWDGRRHDYSLATSLDEYFEHPDAKARL